jgi:RimJ/RimL family protein N-acetyltransferase
VDRPFFTRQSEAIRVAFAAGVGFEVGALDEDQLTVVDRPDPPAWPYFAMVTNFGVGTVLSIDATYRSFVDAHEVEPHHTAAWPGYLGKLAAEAAARGLEVEAGPIALLWALTERPAEPVVPDRLELRRVERDWMNAEQPSERFKNAVGEVGRSARTERNRFAMVLFDEDGQPLAVGGVFETLGLHEIGVDVVPAAQGRGLAPIVVAAAARAVLEEGGAPLYACAATNIRSQRTALAAGFVPIGADAFVS